MLRRRVSNWGLYPEVEANFVETSEFGKITEAVLLNTNLIARGNGRCYGDSSLSETIISTLRLNRFLAFDEDTGEIECEAGVLLSEVLDVIVPRGFFLPVTPGTKYVTVGGAIAADVHGKNHHSEGSFCEYVLHTRLLTEDGSIVTCTPDQNEELFWRTCGGMGLTGIILDARFRLKPIETSYIRQVTRKARDLDGIMKLFEESQDSTYSVAWIDCFAGGRAFGRSMLITGEHISNADLPSEYANSRYKPASPTILDIPFCLPGFALNRATSKLFNFAYYRRHIAERREEVVHFDPFFYPLDRVTNWNRAYGRRGFLQYQFVLPKEVSYDGLKQILDKIRLSGEGSPLAVLKLLGRPHPRAVMSFPIEGYTLALDFQVRDRVFNLLDSLDEIVLKYGGRIYLAKDARMSANTFHSSYDVTGFNGKFKSLQSLRLEIK